MLFSLMAWKGNFDYFNFGAGTIRHERKKLWKRPLFVKVDYSAVVGHYNLLHSAGSYNSRASSTGAPKIWDGSLARKTESLEVCSMARKERLLLPSGFLHWKVIITIKTERKDKCWISWQWEDPSFCPIQTGMPAQHIWWCLNLITKQKCVKK